MRRTGRGALPRRSDSCARGSTCPAPRSASRPAHSAPSGGPVAVTPRPPPRSSPGPQDDLWWLMPSPSVNAARLLLLVLDADAWRTDLPRLARGALALQRAGHWGTTTAHAWGALAVERFAAAFETARVSGTTAAALGGQRETVSWEKDPAGATLDLAWP